MSDFREKYNFYNMKLDVVNVKSHTLNILDQLLTDNLYSKEMLINDLEALTCMLDRIEPKQKASQFNIK
ncbi:MAG: hypothetical protein ACQEV7_10375 [Bacillota bacterium]